jgi:hypothetical protein
MASPDSTLRKLDTASMVLLLITVMLFFTALFERGLTREFLQELAVFLVSAKLVLASRKAELSSRTLDRKLDLLLARENEREPENEEERKREAG